MESEKWNKEGIEKAMEEGKEEFLELSIKLNDIIVDFCVRALRTFEAGSGEPLNPVQVKQVITKEVKYVLEQISDPEFIDIIVRKAEIKYAETLEE